jgi:hypothetical protein
MRTSLVKRLCIAVLFLAFVSWRLIADYELALRVLVCAGAAIVAVQAFRAARRRWAAGFLVIAFLFNPAFRLFGSPAAWTFWPSCSCFIRCTSIVAKALAV